MTSLIHTNAKGDFAQRTDRTLVSTTAFNNEFYTYTTSLNSSFQTVGTFTLVSGATAATCPSGRVLHLSGKKLFPDINPMNTFVAGSPLSAKKFLVSVYDPISFLSGFVDPTSNTFAKFDQNLPNFFDLGTAGSGVEWSGGGQGVDLHVVDSTTYAPTSTAINAGNLTVDVKNASMGGVTIPSGMTVATKTITISTTAATATSRVFLTLTTLPTANLTGVSVTTTAGTIVISAVASGTTAAAVTYNWLVIN